MKIHKKRKYCITTKYLKLEETRPILAILANYLNKNKDVIIAINVHIIDHYTLNILGYDIKWVRVKEYALISVFDSFNECENFIKHDKIQNNKRI